MLKIIFRTFIISLIAFLPLNTYAQCQFKNTAFKSGEFLSYNLYFNWKFIWVKAGSASLSTTETVYNGGAAYRSSLITRSNSRVDKFFILRDTLVSYSSKAMQPLYFRKGAEEGQRYGVDEVYYKYANNKVYIRQHRLNSDGEHTWANHTYNNCLFDMMHIFMRARSFDPTEWKKGKTIYFSMVDGNDTLPAQIKYKGKTIVKADNSKKYRCLQLSYLETRKGRKREVACFFVTDDKNHIPIRIDMNLKFGSAKAFLTTMKGIRNTITSVVK